jgi:protease-4
MRKKGLLTILVVFGFLGTVFFLFMLAALSGVESGLSITGTGIGVVEISGPIMDSKKAVEQIGSFAKNRNIKGIIIRVDSPGGAVAPSQEIYYAVLQAKKSKKVYVSMGNLAASGGYYIACAGDKIYALPGTVTGSIGVITQIANVSELAALAKIRMVTIKSGKYKDMGNPFREFNEDDREVFTSMIDDIYDQFVTHIAEARGMDIEKVKELADGRVYTGRQAHANGLVDELGALSKVAEDLGAEVGIEGEPTLIYPPKDDEEFLQRLLEGSAQTIASGVLRSLTDASVPSFEYRYVGPQ